MKVTGIRNALLFFTAGLVAWVLTVWLPHRGLHRLSGLLGRPENLPPVTRKIYDIDMALYSHRYILLIILVLLSIGYYFFYNWAARKRESRMLLHNVAVVGMAVVVYGFLLYCVAGLRIAIGGLTQ